METPDTATKHSVNPQEAPTPVLNPGSDASRTSLESPASGDPPTLALSLTPDANTTSLELLARGVSDLVKQHLSVDIRFQEQEEKWHKRMQEHEAKWNQRLQEDEAKCNQRLREEKADWYQRSEEKASEMEAESRGSRES